AADEVRVGVRAPEDLAALEVQVGAAVLVLLRVHRLAQVAVLAAELVVLVDDRGDDLDRVAGLVGQLLGGHALRALVGGRIGGLGGGRRGVGGGVRLAVGVVVAAAAAGEQGAG